MKHVGGRIGICLLGLFILSVLSCDADRRPPLTGPGTIKEITPKPDAEAELAALWLTGDLIAPQSTYDVLTKDLATIRARYDDAIDAVSISFHPPWAPSQVIVGFTADAVRRIREETFFEFYALGDSFELAEIDTSRFSRPSPPWAVLSFAGRRHPERMSEAYAALEGIMWAEPNHYVGDWPNVYPWKLGDTRTYLFRKAAGDCPAGCIQSEFFYFRVTDGALAPRAARPRSTEGEWQASSPLVEFVGSFRWHVDPEPTWWKEARASYLVYRGLH